MRSHFLGLMPALVSVLVFLPAGLAETGPRGQQPARAGAAASQFDPHDFSGIWLMTADPRDTPGLISQDVPAMTSEGLAKFNERVPTGVERSNDPAHACNPMGFPRLVLGGTRQAEPMEFVHTDDRFIQIFQWEHRIRYLWLDGRELPSGENLDNLGPAWYGHSVGEWRGDTLVVNTVGLDERAWMNSRGHPYGLDARFEERYRRVTPNVIELQMTLYDPKYYTTPWVGETKTFRRLPREDSTYFGWYGLFAGVTEGICAPMNEIEGFYGAFGGRTTN